MPCQFSTIRRTAFGSTCAVCLGVLALAGCRKAVPPGGAATPAAMSDGHAAAPASDEHDHDAHHEHAEHGPHGGTLLAIGDDFAHLELVLDSDAGKLTAYVLDGQAAEPVLTTQVSLELAFSLDSLEKSENPQKKDELPELDLVQLLPVGGSAPTGASEFAGQTDKLKGAAEFEGVLENLVIGTRKFTEIRFKFPEGNEHDHHHHH